MNAKDIRIVRIRYVDASDLADEEKARIAAAKKFVDGAVDRYIDRHFQRIQQQRKALGLAPMTVES